MKRKGHFGVIKSCTNKKLSLWLYVHDIDLVSKPRGLKKIAVFYNMSPILNKFLLGMASQSKSKRFQTQQLTWLVVQNLQQWTPLFSNWLSNWNLEFCMPLLLKVLWRIPSVNNSLEGAFQLIRPVFYLLLCCGIIWHIFPLFQIWVLIFL